MRVKTASLLSQTSLLILAGAALILIIGVSFGISGQKPRVAFACGNPDLSYVYDENEKTAVFEGNEIPVPKPFGTERFDSPELTVEGLMAEVLAEEKNITNVLGVSQGERWVEIDLSEQKLKAWEGNNLFLESLVSTGLPWWPTPTGEFSIQYKSRAQKMEGGSGKYYYYLPNVPYVMFFGNSEVPWSKGYSLHGTYWHSDFGTRRSHGCVNLPTSIAEKLFYWTSPTGTKVVIHD